MRRAYVFLSLALAVAWLGSGLGTGNHPQAADNSTVQAMAPDQVPTGLTPSEWQGIQAQVAKLIADDGAADDRFGYAVSVSSDTAVVGARGADVGDNENQGAAYVFYRNLGGAETWGQVTRLTANDGAAGDGFGFSASISGDTAVVGAFTADVGGNANQGAAYVFYRNQDGLDAWGQVAKLTAADGAAPDQFGWSVAVSGDTVVVGAPVAWIGGKPVQGAAYVFDRNHDGSDAWGQVAKLIAADGAEWDQFGLSVSVSGDTAVVGAYEADVGANANQGAAYVFYRDRGGADAWGQVTKLTAADGAAYDSFYGVSISGDTIVVGARYADVGGNADQGAAYVFYRNQGGADAWGQVVKLIATDGAAGDYFGSASVSGDTAVVGASRADIGGNEYQGAAYVFYRDRGGTDAWGQAAKLTADDGAMWDSLGGSVSVSGDTVVAGASQANVGSNADQGAAYVFVLTRRFVYLPLVNRSYTP